MKNQRFVIVPDFCKRCKKFGFKFVDTQGEFGETGVFHYKEKSAGFFLEFYPKAQKAGYGLDFIIDNLTRELYEVLLDQIILLPIEVMEYEGQDITSFIKSSMKFYSDILKVKEVSTAALEWQKLGVKNVLIFIPENFALIDTPWIYLLIPPKGISGSAIVETLVNTEKTKSKQSARKILEQAFKDELISKDDLALTLSKIEHLENFPEQTHQEKMRELIKRN